jgi:anthranilate synthase component 1
MQTVENDVRTDGIIKVIPGERFTPYTLAKKLGARAVLESSSFTKGRERYSILLAKEAFQLSQEADGVFLESDHGRTRLPDRGADVLDHLVYFANQHPALHQDLPIPAGGIGYLSWEFARRCDRFRINEKSDPLGVPEALFLFGHVFVVFDHYTDNLYLIGINYREHEIDLAREIAEVQRKLRDLDFNYLADDADTYRSERLDLESDREAFLAGVARIKQEIVAGNLLQCVLSRRETVRASIPPLEAYRRLRSANPSPYLFFLDFGRFQLLGSSPEQGRGRCARG